MLKPHMRVAVLLLMATISLLAVSRFDSRARIHTDKALRGLVDKVSQLRLPNDIEDSLDLEKDWQLARATQHAGTGARVLRFLDKARRGEPFTVAAIGGSGESIASNCVNITDAGSVQGPWSGTPRALRRQRHADALLA